MWVTWKQDDQAIHFWNLGVALEVRFLKIEILLDGYQEILKQRGISPVEFGDPEAVAMVVTGPGAEDFKILASVPKDEHQVRKVAALEHAFRTGLQTGVRLIDLKKVLEEA